MAKTADPPVAGILALALLAVLSDCRSAAQQPDIVPSAEGIIGQTTAPVGDAADEDDAERPEIVLSVGGIELELELSDTEAAAELAQHLEEGPAVVTLSPYGDFEAVGTLPWSLKTDDRHITTQPGDVMLYQGNQLTVFYGSNTWSYTPLGAVGQTSQQELRDLLASGPTNTTLEIRR